MTFGKHKGVDLEDIDDGYLLWVLEKCDTAGPVLKEAIRARLGLDGNQRKAQNPPPPPPPPSGMLSKADLDSKLKQWHRGLAKDYHPDVRKGDGVAMSAINDAHDRLRKTLSI